jgi:hypothetical protein
MAAYAEVQDANSSKSKRLSRIECQACANDESRSGVTDLGGVYRTSAGPLLIGRLRRPRVKVTNRSASSLVTFERFEDREHIVAHLLDRAVADEDKWRVRCEYGGHGWRELPDIVEVRKLVSERQNIRV